MRALVFEAPFALTLVERRSPVPNSGEALVQVEAAGLCAGDLYIYTGKNPYVTYPRVGGHEIAGRLKALGPGTMGPDLGSRVVVEPFIGCGHCYPCRVGKPNCCVNLSIVGVHRDGGFAGDVCVPVDRLHAVPDGLTPFLASFAEPVAIGVQASRRGQVTGADKVLILGAGPIGLATLEVVRAMGAEVYVADLVRERLEVASDLGGVPLEAGENLSTAVMDVTAGEGMPVVIEATGSPAAMAQAAELVAAGGRIVIVGLVKPGVTIPWPGLDLTRKELTIVGSRASTGCFPESLALLASGTIRYPSFATAFDLGAAPTLFADLAADRTAVHKAIFVRADA